MANNKKGVVKDRVLNIDSFQNISIPGNEKVDAAYLVTAGVSPHLPSQIRRLSKHSKRLFVLHTHVDTKIIESDECEIVYVHFQNDLHDKIFQKRSSINPTLEWNNRFDIPSKRNYALYHARKYGFEIVLVIDDDIIFGETYINTAINHIRNGADIVSAYSFFYPDISTIDRLICSHLDRAPEISISGNIMVLKTCDKLSFFPYIYNEDWLFLWASRIKGKANILPAQRVIQRRPRKGRQSLVGMEQFGELIVSMLLLHNSGLTKISDVNNEATFDVCANEQREILFKLKEKYPDIVADAICALDSIYYSDVDKFFKNFESELEVHHESKNRNIWNSQLS